MLITSTFLVILSTVHLYAKPLSNTITPTSYQLGRPAFVPANHDIRTQIAEALGWVPSEENLCGGYYLEAPFTYSQKSLENHLMEISSGPTLFAQHGTSILEGGVTITQFGQQITANKAYVYRNAKTGKINVIDLEGKVHLREPNELVLASQGHLNVETKQESLQNIIYRTAVYSKIDTRPQYNNPELQESRRIYQLTAWGQAHSFEKNEPKIYDLTQVSYTTCPPNSNVWHIEASKIRLNKNTGRGSAYNARLYFKQIPIFYTPYLNFPIDNRRQTGFLFPYFGSSNKKGGVYLGTPFYWNLAPNYDTTITPEYFEQRGIKFNDTFRYLTESSAGNLAAGVIVNDKKFARFQTTSQAKYGNSTSTVTQADLRRLENASTTRGSLSWVHTETFNPHWSGNVNYSYVSDDYYLRDFLGPNLNEVTQNQLLQEGDLDYKSTHWYFVSRLQQYETLHPVDVSTTFMNQYSRFPQLVLNGDYPNIANGKVDAFVSNELTKFLIHPTPGVDEKFPIGTRLYTQPGISLPLNWPYMFITPRVQLSASRYELSDITNIMNSSDTRVIPIFDVAAGMYFDKDLTLFSMPLRQTLEPQIYYLYVPYHNQDQIPVFDTTLNTLSYDQMFTWNRFSGLDRIGDANQVSLGVTTRFINTETGEEKVRASIGQIIYFREREVTLCTVNNPYCLDPVSQRNNTLRKSPISALLNYNLNKNWGANVTTIWNTLLNRMEYETIAVQYHPLPLHIINLGYNYVRNGDLQPEFYPENSNHNNLKQLDFSFAWPLTERISAVGRWTKSINEGHMQNLLFGLQYDSCCWAVRLVAGRTFTNLEANPQNTSAPTPVYDNAVFFQFAFKGLGNIGNADPTQFLSSNITGYNTEFGQNY